ncbi:MAG: PEGA domain-containing protein [Parachlamydiaceae bacterium]|nr:PEGA domain-containing protein [Parachlamydiaceae bacterium]
MSRGTREYVTISSVPSGAKIIIDEQPCGETPNIVQLTRKHQHHILLVKEGYEPEQYLLKPQANLILAANLGYMATGAAVGVGTGLIFFGGTGPWSLPFILAFTGVGAAVGAAVAVGGVGVDLISGGGYSLSSNQVEATLTKGTLSP